MPPHNSNTNIVVLPDYETLSQQAAERIHSLVRSTLASQETFALALAGGSTPRGLYEHLADVPLPWDQIHLYWGDERFVSHNDPDSNVHLVHETLLDAIDIPSTNVHPMPTSGIPDVAASTYADTLHHAFDNRSHTFDLILLGMGEDGHTASLFPEYDPSPTDPEWVRAVSAPPRHSITQRLTCTLPLINGAQQAFVLVSGESKRTTVDAALNKGDSSLPITRVAPRGKLVWLLDDAAAPSTPGT